MKQWEEFLKQQEQVFGPDTIKRWLAPLQILRFDACNLYLQAQDSFQIIWFEEYIRPKLKDFVNNNGSKINVYISSTQVKGAPAKKKEKDNFFLQFDAIDPHATLDSFIVTEENEIPLKLILEAAAGSSHSGHNPLYLYGQSGIGKTHLLQSLVHLAKKNNLSVLYVTGDTFAEHVVKAIRAAEMTKFREIYRKVDLLIVDDVHTLAKRAATQEEFFHTFNTLHNSNRLIVLSSQKPPQNLADIEPRLLSRFEWGLLLHLSPLKKREITHLLKKRAEILKRPLPERAIDFLIESFSTVQSLVRAQDALFARTLLQHKMKNDSSIYSIPSMKSMLSDLIQKEQENTLSPDAIIQSVAKHYGLCLADLIGKSQSRECSTPRKIAMYLCRQKLNMPYMAIGDLFERDHSTVMTAIKQIEKADPQLKNTLMTLESALN